jgi:alpha-tubulin suppressor-like RCC1 family protein
MFASVSAGERFTCGLTPSASVYCWGDGAFGALGTGDTVSRTTPTAVAGGHHFVTLSVGSSHACALESSGAAFCWGQGLYGQLGNGGNVSSNVPVAVGGGQFFSNVSAGETHTCGVSGNIVYCWGYNAHGALGGGQPVGAVILPAPVSGSTTFTTVSAGFRYACAASFGVHCWGLNLSGQLGATTPNTCLGFSDDIFPCSTTPISVPLAKVASRIATGLSHTCILTPIGEAYCWGANGAGQLGDGLTAQQRQAPGKVSGDISFRTVSVGGEHTCGVATNAAFYCWGGNASGQLGTGSTSSVTLPTQVTLPP